MLLVGASLATAELVAERIRRAISVIDFQPHGVEHKLSVSVGGAAFGGPVPFADLYRVADQRLYDAKQAGPELRLASPPCSASTRRAPLNRRFTVRRKLSEARYAPSTSARYS